MTAMICGQLDSRGAESGVGIWGCGSGTSLPFMYQMFLVAWYSSFPRSWCSTMQQSHEVAYCVVILGIGSALGSLTFFFLVLYSVT